ncbi:MAG: DUF5615 family PIN-like protein [Novosphingobium sp.]
MRLLLDVHIGLRIARVCSEAGHEVIRAALEYPTASDTELMALAVSHDLILVTEDSDFTDLIFAHDHAPPPALIYIRCEPFEQAQIAASMLDLLCDERLIGQVAVVTSSQIRFRPFPKGKSPHG